MAPESRAEYFRERRKNYFQLNVSIPKEKGEILSEYLQKIGKTKTQWVIEKIDEELSQK